MSTQLCDQSTPALPLSAAIWHEPNTLAVDVVHDSEPLQLDVAEDGDTTVTPAGKREAHGALAVHGDEVVLGRELHLDAAGEVHRHSRHLTSPRTL